MSAVDGSARAETPTTRRAERHVCVCVRIRTLFRRVSRRSSVHDALRVAGTLACSAPGEPRAKAPRARTPCAASLCALCGIVLPSERSPFFFLQKGILISKVCMHSGILPGGRRLRNPDTDLELRVCSGVVQALRTWSVLCSTRPLVLQIQRPSVACVCSPGRIRLAEGRFLRCEFGGARSALLY